MDSVYPLAVKEGEGAVVLQGTGGVRGLPIR